MRYCGIVQCPNNRGIKDPDCCVFRPKTLETTRKWKIALENLGLECSYYRICKLHFGLNDFTPGKCNRLKPEAVPSIAFMSPKSEQIRELESSSAAIDSVPLEMVESKMVLEADETSSFPDNNESWETLNDNTSVQSKNTTNQCTECTKNFTKMQFLAKENENLRKKYKKLLDEVYELRKSQNQCSAPVDEDCEMTIENELEDDCHEECCKVCGKKLTADEKHHHICINNLIVFRCEYCSALLKSTAELCNHLNEANHPDTKMYKCKECTVEYPSALLLMFHQMSELKHPKSTDNVKMVQCCLCDADFDSNSAMQAHIREHLLVRKCELCKEQLTLHELGEHLCDVHEIIHCEYCNEPFNATIKLIQHLDSQHADDSVLYKCGQCSTFFKMTMLKDIHEKYHPVAKPKPYRCGDCNKGFTTESNLHCHNKLFHGNQDDIKYVCEKCGKRFVTRGALAYHSLGHGERKFRCPECPAAFKRKQELAKHSSVHQSTKKYQCSQCAVKFVSQPSLEAHIRRVHQSKERRFACKLCSLKFRSNDRLKTHMRSHTGEKPHTCTYCDQRYAYKGDLNKHLKVHVGKNIYTCEECGQGFQFLADLRRHHFEHYKSNKDKPNENSVDADATK